jgi:four helix bundle protein
MPFQQEDLRDRTKAFAVRVVRVFRSLLFKTDAQVLGKQLMRSETSVAANYRADCRSRSKAEWVAKIGIVVEEADETVFWLEMLSDCDIVRQRKLASLLAEAHELSAIFTASHFTARRNR